MQQTSETYDALYTGNHVAECKAVINGIDYEEDVLWDLSTERISFSENNPSVGSALAGQISIKLDNPQRVIPRMSEIRPYVRLSGEVISSTIVGIAIAGISVVGTYESTVKSEWLPKGVFYIDTREIDEANDRVVYHGYDAMLKAEKYYPASTMSWPAKDANVLREIAEDMGVQIDARTWQIIPSAGRYDIPLPAQYTEREVLGFIAAMYCGNFIMSDTGELLLIALNGLPEEEYLLINENGDYITFGTGANETRILLRAEV